MTKLVVIPLKATANGEHFEIFIDIQATSGSDPEEFFLQQQPDRQGLKS